MTRPGWCVIGPDGETRCGPYDARPYAEGARLTLASEGKPGLSVAWRGGVTIHKGGRLIRTSRNLRGILAYARVSPVASVDCQRLESETDGGRLYSVTFLYDDGAVGQSDWADWRVLAQWLKARRSWDVGRVTGLAEFVAAFTES